MPLFFKDTLWKLSPKLRLVANGSSTVNSGRAEGCGAVALDSKSSLVDQPQCRQQGSRSSTPEALARVDGKRGRLKRLPRDIFVNVILQQKDEHSPLPVGRTRAIGPKMRIARVRLSQLTELARDKSIGEIALAQDLKEPQPIINELDAPPPKRVRRPVAARRPRGSPPVIIGIVDVQGFDFSHVDFLDKHGTRFATIWDQGGNARKAPKNFGYGAEFSGKQLNKAIKASKSLGVSPWELEPQSQTIPGSHGTHVASIAAGNRGVCPNSLIAGVLVSLPSKDLEQRKSFFDSTRIIDAVRYLIDFAKKKGLPVSINISLGTNGHAHDGTALVNRWLDHELTAPGVSICVAAGNAGQDRPTKAGDLGHMLGRIHTSGRLKGKGDRATLEWVVVGDGVADVSENELEIWLSPRDRVAVRVRPPDGPWLDLIEPGQFVENKMLPSRTFVSVYNDLYHPANGANYIAIYLSPFFGKKVLGIEPGTWKVELVGGDIRSGEFHGWIERDDPRPAGQTDASDYWMFPSFFSDKSYVGGYSVNSLGCSRSVITVANYDMNGKRMNVTSSQGPTREGGYKPDICAPGTEIRAAKGFADASKGWLSMTGTSMASPYVAGVVGLMLSEDSTLTASQLLGILQRTAEPFRGKVLDWRGDCGHGVINPEACISEAADANLPRDVT